MISPIAKLRAFTEIIKSVKTRHQNNIYERHTATHIVKKVILIFALACLAATASRAVDITWQVSGSISGTTDVTTQGTYFGSWAPYNAGAPAFPVNGISFQGFSDLPNLQSNNFVDGGAYFNQPNTPDSNYNNLLQYGAYGNNSTVCSFGWDQMIPGDTYLVEIWVNDVRNLGGMRWENFSGGSDFSPNVYFPSDGTGSGQFIIGTFVADATGSETVFIYPSSSGIGSSAQVNLVQVRDITVPEPAAGCFIVMGLTCLATRRRILKVCEG